ncbi:MAG: hypothetical protein ABSB40_13700 [Nitrososphaeria archaeon]
MLRNQVVNLTGFSILSPKNEIKSVTVDTSDNRIYFSTDSEVYTIRDSCILIIVDKFGGILRYFNSGLIVFVPEKQFLVRIVGIEDQITSKMQSLKAVAESTQTSNAGKKSTRQIDSVSQVKLMPSDKIATPQHSNAKVKETVKQPAPEILSSTGNRAPSQPKTFYVEKFISSTSENLEQGKTYILKKDYSLTTGIFIKLPEGTILRLVGTDADSITSWEVVQPLDGSSALINSHLYTYFKENHLWIRQP